MRKNFSIWPQNLRNLHKSSKQGEGVRGGGRRECVGVYVHACVCEIACDNGEIMDYAKLLSTDDALTVSVDPVGEEELEEEE